MEYTILKRMAQAIILLLFTLMLTVGGRFFFMPEEAEAAEGMDAEQIRTDRLIQELIVRDTWESAFRDKRVLMNEDEMQNLYYALEVFRDEKVVLNEDYAEAYYGFLRERYRSNPYVEAIAMGFRLVYIDGDDIPELLLMEDYCHAAGVLVYTYYDGRMIEVGGFGSFGGMLYLEKEGRISGGFTGQGATESYYYELEQGKLKEICRLYIHPGHEDPLEKFYEIDDVPVSEEVYKAKRQKLRSDEYIYIGYDDAVFFTETNLRALLAQEIEELRAEER